MLFNSVEFLVFFPVVLLIYFVIPKKTRYIWLLVASYYFYMGWNPKYAILIAISTVVTYFCGICLDKINEKNTGNVILKKKLVVAASLIINLGILGYFKYYDFFLANINKVLHVFSDVTIYKRFDVVLPVGISFYTFQALGYTIDVYRGQIKAEKNVLKYALFVSFFPQLVAGPIERSKNLLTQVKNVHNINVWNYENITRGFMLIVWGLFQKMVIADRAAIFVDAVYNEYWKYGTFEFVVANFLFAIQAYCDFASYSTIAMGTAKMMGFELMENFKTPYFVTSVRDYWRRWHISLTKWFQDYLYFPLGGSRCSKLRHYFNLMVTFAVSGLWHGASWHYVIWSSLHGFYQIIEMELDPLGKKIVDKFHMNTEAMSYKFGQMVRTFILLNLSWSFFRGQTMGEVYEINKRIFLHFNPWVLFDKSMYKLGLDTTEWHILIVSIVILILVDVVKKLKDINFDDFLKSQGIVFRFLVLWVMLFMIVSYGVYGPGFDASAFIYFQF